MIIEAGYDLHELLYPRLIRDHDKNAADGDPLWVVALDDKLRFLFMRPAAPKVRLPLTEHAAEIAACLDDDLSSPKYVVLAFFLRTAPDHPPHWLYELGHVWDACPELAGFEMLGQIAFDEDGYYSSLPRYSFRDYAGHQDLPRAAVIAGPHPCDCACLACEQHAEDVAALRRRARERRRDDDADEDADASPSGRPRYPSLESTQPSQPASVAAADTLDDRSTSGL